MAKISQNYIDWDYDAASDAKILRLRQAWGWEGYGLFVALIGYMCKEGGIIPEDEIEAVGFGLGVNDSIRWQNFIDTCMEPGLLKKDDRGIYNERVLEHLAKRQKLSESGKKSAKNRWEGALDHPIEQNTPEPASQTFSAPGSSVVVMTTDELREAMLGQMFLEECATKLKCNLNAITYFANEWTAMKEVSGDFCYTRAKLRQYMLNDFAKAVKESKTISVGGSQIEGVRQMTETLGVR